jgi:hypothetical protein
MNYNDAQLNLKVLNYPFHFSVRRPMKFLPFDIH